VSELRISIDDPYADDVRALLERHLAFAHAQSPPEDVHALDVERLVDRSITFFSSRRDGMLLAIGALKHLDDEHAELKSMHTAAEVRGRGVGGVMLGHLLMVAKERGYRRVSIETGSMAAFAPARAMYSSAGFTTCGPFGDYVLSPNAMFMTLEL
jgi:putative acetyltransferase